MAGLDHFRQFGDQELADAIGRLERTVATLAEARGEIGQRIRHRYQAELDAARAEAERRAA